MRKCRAILRKQAFAELAEKARAGITFSACARWPRSSTQPLTLCLSLPPFHRPTQDGRAAVRYLQKEVAAVANQAEPNDAEEYGRLASRVFGKGWRLEKGTAAATTGSLGPWLLFGSVALS